MNATTKSEAVPAVGHEMLRRLAVDLLSAAGCASDEAGAVADHLVEANLKGHDSHGVVNLPGYIRRLRKGETLPNQELRLIRDDGPFLVVDAGRGLGQSVTSKAMALAIERTGMTGVTVLAMRNSCHAGRIGTYGEQCASAGLISLHFVNVSGQTPYVAPHGARTARFSTNPFCFAVPGGPRGEPVILDCATSAVAWGKLKVAFNKGEQVAEGLLLDAAGRPTCDPVVMVPDPLGAMITFGGHKGSGIALICELLGAALAGGDTVQPGNIRDGVGINNMLSILIDPGRVTTHDRFGRECEAMVDYVRSAAPLDATKPVMVAGDPERRSKAQRLREGIRLDAGTWRDLRETALSLGLDPAAFTPP